MEHSALSNTTAFFDVRLHPEPKQQRPSDGIPYVVLPEGRRLARAEPGDIRTEAAADPAR